MNQIKKHIIQRKIMEYPEWFQMENYVFEPLDAQGDYFTFCIAGFVIIGDYSTNFHDSVIFLKNATGDEINEKAASKLEITDDSLFCHGFWPDHLLYQYRISKTKLERAKLACQALDWYDDSHPELREEQVRELWAQLGDIPINDKEEVEERFYSFPIGTHREEIWHWFEDSLNTPSVILKERETELQTKWVVMHGSWIVKFLTKPFIESYSNMLIGTLGELVWGEGLELVGSVTMININDAYDSFEEALQRLLQIEQGRADIARQESNIARNEIRKIVRRLYAIPQY